MPQVFAQGGGVAVVPAPMLSGNYIPNIDTLAPSGLGLVSPWGSGANVRRYSPSSGTTLTPASAAIQDSLALLAASVSPQPPIVNFNFEGLVGPQGPPGPSVAPIIYEVVPWGARQADYPPAVFMGDLTVDFPMTNGITFSQDGTACDWTAGTLTYKGTTYEISAGSAVEANKWIYWDSNSSPTTFSSTATLATAIGATKWVMAYHVSGVPSPAFQSKIIHGGLIQADTITAIHIASNTITATQIFANTITYDELRQVGGSEAVGTLAIRDAAAAISQSSITAGAEEIGSSWETIQTLSNFPSEGGTVRIMASVRIDNKGSSTDDITLGVWNSSDQILLQEKITCGATYDFHHFLQMIEVPGSGNQTYYLKAIGLLGARVEAKERTIYCEETKR